VWHVVTMEALEGYYMFRHTGTMDIDSVSHLAGVLSVL